MAATKASKVAQAETKTVELYRLYDVANQVGFSYSTLQMWHKDDEVATPAPQFVVGDTEYWTAESFPVWKELVDTEIQRVASTGHTLEEMTDKVLRMAEQLSRKASYTRSRDRSGYSKSALKERIIAVEAVYDFVARLSETGYIEPAEKRREILKHIQVANAKISQ